MATETVELKVAMSCQGCVGAVKRVLTKLDGVDSYDIDLKQQKVTVTGKLPPPVVFEAVSKTGKATSFWPAEEKASEEVKEETKVETPLEETVKG